MSTPVYLDNCATTQVCEPAAQAALEAMRDEYGNPSSLHDMGLGAEHILRRAREQAAAAIGCRPDEIVFTSGGTESNNLAVIGAAYARRRRGHRVVTTMIEHSSVAGAFSRLEEEGFEVVRLRPGADGSVTAEDIRRAVNADTILVSLMLVNNETGAIQPVAAARGAVRTAGAPALIHCDAVQAFGKIAFTPQKLGVDLLSVSAHKIHAPKGAGALFVAKGTHILPLVRGGGQEGGLRSGTEAVPAIAGFGAATQLMHETFADTTARMAALRERCRGLLASRPYIAVNSPEKGAPHILNVSVLGVKSETMLHFLSSRGIYVSSGSACSKGARSPVLTAMGLPPERVDTALRISFGRFNTEADADRLAEAIDEGVRTLVHAY